MSTSENPLDQDTEDQLPSELQVLKQRADLLGITYSNNIGLDSLRKKVEDKLSAQDDQEQEPAAKESVNPLAQAAPEVKKTKTLRQYLLARETKLVRLRITNMDPKKADLPGDIYTVANEYLGTIRKYVPFGEATDNGYHVPWCIYELLKTKQFLQVKTTKGRNGQIQIDSRWVREFGLEVLPELTPAELARLAADQRASGRLD